MFCRLVPVPNSLNDELSRPVLVPPMLYWVRILPSVSISVRRTPIRLSSSRMAMTYLTSGLAIR